MEEKILPILRFDNFNDYWRTSSLLSQVEVRRGLTYNPNDVRSKGARVLRSSNIVDDSFVISDDDVFVSKDVINIPRVSNGDILVTAANGSTKLVGKHAIIKNLPDDEIVVHGGFMLLFKTEQNYFVNAWMSSNEYKRVLQFVQGGNGAIGNLSSTILKSMKMSVPSLLEQSAIGSLFRNLDDLLASYKDNIANYQSLKATMLTKMFPKAGQTVPEIRLDGFEGEWKEKEFSKLVKRVTQSSDSDSLPKVEFEDIISGQGRLNKDISNKFDNRKGIHFKPGYTLYGKLRPYLNNWLLPKFEGVALGDFWVFDPNGNDSNFIYYLVQSNRYQKVANDTSGTKMPRSDWKSVSSTIFAIPQTIAEQQAIGAYFSNLDNLINSHQEKISQLETLKKKLLQDMFV